MIANVWRHILLLIVAMVLAYFAWGLPSVILRPGILSGLTPLQALGELNAPDFEGWLSRWPLLVIVAAIQAAVFRFVPKWPSIWFLGIVVAVSSILAWAFVWFVFYLNL